jgi:hypothetical protein
MNSVFSLVRGTGLRVELADEHSRVLRLEREIEKMRVQYDSL